MHNSCYQISILDKHVMHVIYALLRILCVCIITGERVHSNTCILKVATTVQLQLHLAVCLVEAGDDPLVYWTICFIGLQVNALLSVTSDLSCCSADLHFFIRGHRWVWCGGRLALCSSDEVEEECSKETSNSEGDHTTQHSCNGYCCSKAELLKVFCVTTWIWVHNITIFILIHLHMTIQFCMFRVPCLPSSRLHK